MPSIGGAWRREVCACVCMEGEAEEKELSNETELPRQRSSPLLVNLCPGKIYRPLTRSINLPQNPIFVRGTQRENKLKFVCLRMESRKRMVGRFKRMNDRNLACGRKELFWSFVSMRCYYESCVLSHTFHTA